MTRCLLIGVFIFAFFEPWCCSQNANNDQRLSDIISKKGQAEVSIAYPGKKAFDHLTRNISVSRIVNNEVHIILSALTADWFITEGFDYKIIERIEGKGLVGAGSVIEAMEWESYPTWNQYDSIMQYFASNYAELCRLDTIGTSINGRLIFALKISDNVTADEDEPCVFYSSTIHGDETGGFVLMLRLAGYLLNNYGIDGRTKNLVDNLQIWINPLANPDGTYTDGDTITSPTRANADGYDLNRNFPDPLTPNTVKQKETVDMMKFLKKHRFVSSANFHSGAEVVNYPWDRWERYHADNDWFYDISREYVDTVHEHSVAGYMTDLDNGVTNGYEWYPIYGGRQDYVTYEVQGREVTIELDDDYITPANELASLWEYNRSSLLGYFENALYGIHGRVEDSRSGKPVAAKIFIEDHDKDNSHIYSDTLTGSFIRLVEPGIWNLTFTAGGYHDTIIHNITVNARQRTDLQVKMVSIFNPVDTTNPPKPLLYPNPATFLIKAVLPESLRGSINIKIYDPSGMKISDYNTEAFTGIPVTLDIRSFPAGAYTVVFLKRSTGMSMRCRFIIARRF